MKIQPCPICGESVEVERDGSCMEISCCVTMSRQKIDYINDYFERGYAKYNEDTNMYQDDVEAYVLDVFLKEWNTRGGTRQTRTNATPISYMPIKINEEEKIEIKFNIQEEEYREDRVYTLEQEFIIMKGIGLFNPYYEVSMSFDDFPNGENLKEGIDVYGKWLVRMGSALIEENKKGSFESIKV